MKMLKQTLSMLLVLCMVLGMVPFSAFAATTIAEKPKGGSTTAQPFPSNTGGSQYFRIPALVTTGSGRVVAGIDARWNGTGDACGIDTMTSYSDDGGNNWNYTFANYLGDNNLQYIKNAATFIDPAIAVDGNTLYMLVDLYAANYAINTADYSPLTGNPFTDDGYLKLKASGAQTYDYYLKDGKIYDLNNTAVKHYTVDEYFNLNNNNKQESNLFYAEAAYQAYPTTHLYLTKSTDGGTTWGTPTLLKVKEDSEYFYGICPGRGLVTSDGTIMFACYVYGGNASTQRASVIYSTDNGATWNRSGNITTDIWSSETQLVELEDGTICAFFRNGQGNICYAQATGNATSGYTWGNYVNTGVSNHSDCMLSAIKLSKTHNGQEVILVSCPTNTGSRANGKFTTFLVGENNTLTRANQYEINGSGQHFAYSCMTELSAAKEDGAYKVGILYENANAAVTYAEYDIETITGLDFDVHVTDSTGAITATVVKLGRTQTYTIQNLAGVTASAVSDNEGVVTASVADGVLSLTGVANGTATVTVTAGQAQVTLAVTVDAKEQEIDLAVGQQQTITVDSTITAGNHSSTAADVSWIPASENFPSAQTLSNSTYGTTTIKLDECLYTLTKDANNQYYLTADADDTTVYVSPHAGAGDAGYPNRTNATQNVVFANSTYTNGAITLSDSSGSLHFHSETGNNHLMWNQCNSVCGVNHDMFIYAVGDTTSNTVLGGYYTQITDVANLTPNQKYLILAKDTNGTYYALYPSLSKATRYDQIAKVTNTFSGYATGDTAITITAKAVGETSVEIGDITYKIKVNAAEATEPDAANVVDVNLYVGENKTIEIQKVITSGTHESNAADVEWAAAEVEALTYKAIQGTDTGFNGTQVEFSACLYTFKYSAANRYVISAKTSANQTVYVNPYYTLGSPNRTTRTVVEVQEGLSSEQVKLYGNSGSLHFHPEAPTPYWNRCGNDTTSGCNVLMLYRPVKAGETSSTEIPGYVKIAGRDALAEEVGTGSGQYLIVGKNDEGNYYLLYPTTATSTATQKRTQMAKVSGIPTSVAGTAITVTANDEGTTSVIIDDTKYNITVSYREASVAAYIGTAVSVTPSGTITQADIDAFNTAHSGKVSVALTDGKLVFTGIAEGPEFTAILGNTRYRITTAKVVENITLYVGVTQNDFIDGYTYDATNITQPDNTYAYIHSATAENGGTKVVFSGVAEGTTDTATVGHVKYNITVKSLRSGGDIPDFNCVVAEKSYPSGNTSTNLTGKKVNSLRITAGAKFDLGVDVTGYDSIAWTTADPAVATVDTTGQVTAVAEGTTLVTATVIKNGITESIAVHVTVVPSLVEGCNADQIASVVFYTEEVYKTDPFYTLFLSSENETGPVAEHTMVMVMEGEVLYFERPKAAAYAMVWTADPWDHHALTAMSAANTLGQYYPLQSQSGVVGTGTVTADDGTVIKYFKCTDTDHSTQGACPAGSPYHNVVEAGTSAGASWKAALDKLLDDSAQVGKGMWTQYGCDGVMITSRSYNDNGPNVATSQVFISDKLPEVTKVVDGVLPVTRKYDYYRRYDPTTSPVVVATIGEQVYFKITVTLERPHAFRTVGVNPNYGANIYDDGMLQDVMKDINDNPVGKDIGFFYTKELDNADGKWDGIIADNAKTQQENITEWLNAPWGENEEKRVKELYFLYTIPASDMNRTTLGNEIDLNYSYSSQYSTGISTGGAVANAAVLITGKMLDPAVIDFGEGIRGEIFADQLGNAVRGEANYGTVDIRGNLLTYTPNAILQDMDTVRLYDTGGKLINSLIVYPATTVYYEEDFLVKENSGWTLGGTNTIVGSNGFQTLEKLGAALYDTSGQYIETITDKKHPYGYDPMYQAIGASGGTYAAATAVGATTSFTFTGTGFDLYANCKLNTGYVAVTLKDAAGKAVKMYTVNTVLKDAQSEIEEYNLPIVSELALPHGTYTVEVRKIVNDGKEVRLDGVRIYNTLEDTSYFAIDLEDSPLFFELRDYVLKALNIGYSEQYDTATGIANQVYGLLNGDSDSDEKPTVSAVVLDTAKRTSRDIQATKVNIEYHDGGRYEQIIVQGIYKEYDAVVKETVEDICDLAKFMTADGKVTVEPNRSGVKNRTETPIICDKVEVTTTTTTYADGVTSEETVVDAITGAQTTEIFKIIVNRYGNDIVALEANASEVVNQESEKTVFESKQSTTTAQDLLDNGPKNELFLYPGQSLTFKVETSRMMQLGLKAPLAATNYSLQYVVDGKTTVVADNQALNSSVDMFYNLNDPTSVNIANQATTITATGGKENSDEGSAKLVDGDNSSLYKFYDAKMTNEQSVILTYEKARNMNAMAIAFENVGATDGDNYAFTYSILARNGSGEYDTIVDHATANRTNNSAQSYSFTEKKYSEVKIVMHSCTTNGGTTAGWPAIAEFEVYSGVEYAVTVTNTSNTSNAILSVTKLKVCDDPNAKFAPLTVADIRQALLASGYPADAEEETPDADPTVPMETQPVETQPVETQPVETQPVETKPAVTEPENAFGCTKDIDCVLSQFTDADANEWYHDGVHFCVAEGLMNGMGEGIFAPNDPTTRAQLVTMLYRLMGSPKAEGKTEPFTDVAEGEWYYDAIVWAYSENVVKGISETEFAPNANVTREQVATILHRFLATPEGTGKLDSFSDAASVSTYAKDALVWAVGEGLINGVAQTDGKVLLDPTGTATRAQIATILYRYLENA